jgi:hypothetical protein
MEVDIIKFLNSILTIVNDYFLVSLNKQIGKAPHTRVS